MDDLDAEVLAARKDARRLNNLIDGSRRFILGCASRASGRFLTESDDEWSVALLAFSEAVESYDGTRGPFRPFAAMVIRRRVLDYRRTEARHAPEIPVEPFSMDGEAGEEETVTPLQLELRQRNAELSAQSEASGAADARAEIGAVQALLRVYGFSFFDLADCSPRAAKTRRCCAAAVKALLGTPGLPERMRQTGTLPIREVCESSGVPRKILERHRKYIIAAAEILQGDYPILAGYLGPIRKAL